MRLYIRCVEAVDQHISFVQIPRQIFCVRSFCLTLKFNWRLWNFLCFTVQTRSSIVSFGVMCARISSQTSPECVSIMLHRLAKRRTKNHLQEVCLSPRRVSYFHTSYDLKIFCDTFFNNVTVYKITLFFYPLHLVLLEPPLRSMVWIIWEVAPWAFLRIRSRSVRISFQTHFVHHLCWYPDPNMSECAVWYSSRVPDLRQQSE